ncbi:MAG TPA: hypothetical protein VK627_07465 [Edaphobacter sp.]|nr:hypothetical protein [Edaphobacter sp.]
MPLRRVSLALVAIALTFISAIHAQSAPEPIPGVKITNGSIPWAVDTYEGKQ